MTEQEILITFGRAGTSPSVLLAFQQHPAWKPFVRAMVDRQYGFEALASAWAWFTVGWESAT